MFTKFLCHLLLNAVMMPHPHWLIMIMWHCGSARSGYQVLVFGYKIDISIYEYLNRQKVWIPYLFYLNWPMKRFNFVHVYDNSPEHCHWCLQDICVYFWSFYAIQCESLIDLRGEGVTKWVMKSWFKVSCKVNRQAENYFDIHTHIINYKCNDNLWLVLFGYKMLKRCDVTCGVNRKVSRKINREVNSKVNHDVGSWLAYDSHMNPYYSWIIPKPDHLYFLHLSTNVSLSFQPLWY